MQSGDTPFRVRCKERPGVPPEHPVVRAVGLPDWAAASGKSAEVSDGCHFDEHRPGILHLITPPFSINVIFVLLARKSNALILLHVLKKLYHIVQRG